MRADARKNYEQLLAVAGVVVAEQGADASLREVARRAGVGLGTLYRHFPTREALLEALLHTNFDDLTGRAVDLESSDSPGSALLTWVQDCTRFTTTYHGVTQVMMSAIEDPESPLHTSCVALRTAGGRLLTRAQDAGVARTAMDGTDLFALIAGLAWLCDQPALAPRAEHLFDAIARPALMR
ncbi:TetR/AcrR family transcriptional regulator [Pseudonocardia sp. HH130629-09]|uniref:TetR/AcrR family transcriptional regulator n=1 Tax=Pseudonocardia sp. HH130629-09 TaxID=1641402 RepID=UPI0006CB3618|nr:TetR/AcrR family transcriptional regulator [Pseudonocardia sp. HH130629-09]ALE85283.1 TetR family transcriptional regulator [Pseudonocardia sp. HH130629-09]